MKPGPPFLLLLFVGVGLTACSKRGAPHTATEQVGSRTEAPANPEPAAPSPPPTEIGSDPPHASPTSPSKMVKIPAGEFTMGCDPSTDSSCAKDEQPARRVHLDAFMIEVTEVTTAQYMACIAAGSCSAPYSAPGCNFRVKGREDHPINCLDAGQGEEFCQWAGRNLPTEAQWEKAARGADKRRFPWGDAPATCAHAVMRSDEGNSCGRGVATWKVGSRPAGASIYGALDMAGNVAEFVLDSYDPAYYSQGGTHNPRGPRGSMKGVARGGCYADTDALRSVARRPLNRGRNSPEIGFRCVGEVEP